MTLREAVLQLFNSGWSREQIFRKSMKAPLSDPLSRLTWDYMNKIIRTNLKEKT